MINPRRPAGSGRTPVLTTLAMASLALAVSGPVLTQQASAAAVDARSNQVLGRNLVANGGFENGTLNWRAASEDTSLQIKRNSRRGARFARVTTTKPSGATLRTRRDVVSATAKGSTYLVSAHIRTNRPAVRGVLRALETKGARTEVTRRYFSLTSRNWTRVSFAVTTATTGGELNADVSAFRLPRGTFLDVDNVRLARRWSASSRTSTTPSPTTVPVSTPTTTPTTTPTATPTGWKPQYSTSFSSLSGWTVFDGQTQSNDNSVNVAKNVTAGAGGLTITGKREPGYAKPFTTGEIVGRTSGLVVPNYFRAEVTGVFKDESGIWPCLLWFRPHSGGDGSNGEIDVMEWMGGMWSGAQKRVAITMHNEYGPTQDSIKRPLTLSAHPWYDPNVPHTYTVEKVPGSITVWVDGRKISTFTAADKSWWNRIMESSTRTWYPRITLQIGAGSTTKVVPNPLSTWQSTTMGVTSLKLWSRS